MAWRTVAITDCKLTPVEQAVLNSIQGGTGGLQTRLTDTVAEFIGAMTAAGYNVKTDGSVPDQLRGHILARCLWLFLTDFAQLKSMMTDGRRDTANKAEEMLQKIASRTAGAIEDPSGTAASSANWNSENKLILRTHPIPPASTQTPPVQPYPGYSNPNAPADN